MISTVSAVNQIILAFGPMTFGMLYAASGAYTLPFAIGSLLYLVAAITVMLHGAQRPVRPWAIEGKRLMKRRGYRGSEGRVGMRRRDFLAGSLAAGVSQAPLTQAIGQIARGPFTPIQPRFIDAHCHMFNVLDVPAKSFIEKVVLKTAWRKSASATAT